MSLYLYKGMEPPSDVIADANNVIKLSPEQIEWIIKNSTKNLLERKLYTVKKLDEICKLLKITEDMVLSGLRFLRNLVILRYTVTDEEFRSDLEKLGFSKDQINHINTVIEQEKENIDDKLRDLRSTVLPRISQINWHVGERKSSSEYLPEPEVYAIIKFTIDGDDNARFELDKRQLVWLDTILEKIKDEFIKWEDELKNSS